MSEFLAMGGHGAYVWGAYGMSLAVLVAVGAWPLLAMRRRVRDLRRRRSVATDLLAAEADEGVKQG